MKQTTFASLAFDRKKKQTRRERFLAEMETVPWAPEFDSSAPKKPFCEKSRQCLCGL
jgi:hypothetical protein